MLLAAAVVVVVVVPVVAAAVVAGAGAVVLAAVVEVGSVVVEAGRVVETVVGSAVVAGCVVTGAPVVGRWLELSGHVMPAVLMSEMSGYGLRVLWGSNGARGLGVTVPSTCWKGACVLSKMLAEHRMRKQSTNVFVELLPFYRTHKTETLSIITFRPHSGYPLFMALNSEDAHI